MRVLNKMSNVLNLVEYLYNNKDNVIAMDEETIVDVADKLRHYYLLSKRLETSIDKQRETHKELEVAYYLLSAEYDGVSMVNEELINVLRSIAYEYIELSQEKAKLQRDELVMRARNAIKDL